MFYQIIKIERKSIHGHIVHSSREERDRDKRFKKLRERHSEQIVENGKNYFKTEKLHFYKRYI